MDEEEEEEAAAAAYPTKGAAAAKGKGGIPAAQEAEEGPVKGEAWTFPPILSPDYPDGKAPLVRGRPPARVSARLSAARSASRP